MKTSERLCARQPQLPGAARFTEASLSAARLRKLLDLPHCQPSGLLKQPISLKHSHHNFESATLSLIYPKPYLASAILLSLSHNQSQPSQLYSASATISHPLFNLIQPQTIWNKIMKNYKLTFECVMYEFFQLFIW